jgi:hypothetical protein
MNTVTGGFFNKNLVSFFTGHRRVFVGVGASTIKDCENTLGTFSI